MALQKYNDHNGKEIRVYDAVNVRISTPIHTKAATYARKKGLKIGKLFEMAVLEKMKLEK